MKNFYEYLKSNSYKSGFHHKRWNQLIKSYPYSGAIKIPIRYGKKEIHPCYFVYEEYGQQSSLHFKFVDDRDPLREGAVYGFFGFSLFKNYKAGKPIFLVEGLTDWFAVKKFVYPYVLATFFAGISQYQRYILRSLTDKLYVGFDQDEAGNTGSKQLNKFREFKVKQWRPLKQDYGLMLESDYGIEALRSSHALIFDSYKKWMEK